MGGQSSATVRRARGHHVGRRHAHHGARVRPLRGTHRGTQEGVRRARRRHRTRQRKWVLEAALVLAILVVTLTPFPGR
jgi:hypothetical protein